MRQVDFVPPPSPERVAVEQCHWFRAVCREPRASEVNASADDNFHVGLCQNGRWSLAGIRAPPVRSADDALGERGVECIRATFAIAGRRAATAVPGSLQHAAPRPCSAGAWRSPGPPKQASARRRCPRTTRASPFNRCSSASWKRSSLASTVFDLRRGASASEPAHARVDGTKDAKVIRAPADALWRDRPPGHRGTAGPFHLTLEQHSRGLTSVPHATSEPCSRAMSISLRPRPRSPSEQR